MTDRQIEKLVEAIECAFVSPNVPDDNLEAANLVDTTNRIAGALGRIAKTLDRMADAMTRRND